MLKAFKSQDDGTLTELSIESIEKGSWISLIAPTADELQTVQRLTNVESNFLRAALDEEERSHTDVEETGILVLTNVPILRESDVYDTLPLGTVITHDYFITVCLEGNAVLNEFSRDTQKLFRTFKKTRFLFQILYKSATYYLKYLRQISHKSEQIEDRLRESMRNEEILRLRELSKGLTYFNAAIRSDGAVLDKLLRLRSNLTVAPMLKMYEEDEDLLEDVIIENKQAREMAEMYSAILSRMADTFSSIISNNQNSVMKFLAAVTIILAIPTVISSFFGMNVDIPFATQNNAFLTVAFISAAMAGAASYILWRHNMF